jgi:hypothetical protein
MSTMSGADLRVVQTNSQRLVASYLTRLKPGASPHAVQMWCHMLGGSYRALAITAFLLDADVAAFRRYCVLAERCRSYFLIRVHLGMPAGDEFIAATYDDHLFNAMAGGDFEEAALLSAWTPSSLVPGLDDETRFHFSMFVRASVDDQEEAAGEELERLNALPAAGAYASVAQGLHHRDGAKFRRGLAEYVEAYEARAGNGELQKEIDEILSVEGVGLARLARHKKISFQFDHRLVPSELTQAAEYEPVSEGYPQLTAEEWSKFENFLNADA